VDFKGVEGLAPSLSTTPPRFLFLGGGSGRDFASLKEVLGMADTPRS
jgi:hypothetical protein